MSAVADPDLFAVVLGPLLVGLALWLLAEAARWWFGSVAGTRARRRKIISLMGRAVALQARAINDGRFDRAWIESSDRSLSKVREKYDDLTAQALDLFEPGEQVVAFWTAAEFYAGWYAPTEFLRATAVPRKKATDGWPLLSTSDLSGGWMAARPAELAAWAQVRWPWDRGNARGPRYADHFSAGDKSRHESVVPNSDVNVDMLRPFILYLPNEHGGPFEPPSKREERRLARYWDRRNEAFAANRQMHAGGQTSA
jgi:hypothetical protein